jgi:hypothetical protein
MTLAGACSHLWRPKTPGVPEQVRSRAGTPVSAIHHRPYFPQTCEHKAGGLGAPCFAKVNCSRFLCSSLQIPCPSILSEPTKSLSIIVPAYNEEDRLPATLDETLKYVACRAEQSRSGQDKAHSSTPVQQPSFKHYRLYNAVSNSRSSTANKFCMQEASGE